MARPPAYEWAFAPRFRRHAFGWRPQPAVQRVREATAEIQKVARKDPALAAAGAALFLEKVSPAGQGLISSKVTVMSPMPFMASAPESMRPTFCRLEIRSPFCAYIRTKLCLGVQ